MKDLTSIYSNNEETRYLNPGAYLLGGGIEIGEGDDLRNEKYLVHGNYICSTTNKSLTLKNCPDQEAFILKVEGSTGSILSGVNIYTRQWYRFINGNEYIVLYDGWQKVWLGPYQIVSAVNTSIDISSQIRFGSDFINASQLTVKKAEYFPVTREVALQLLDGEGVTSIMNVRNAITFENLKYLPKQYDTRLFGWGHATKTQIPRNDATGESGKLSNFYNLDVIRRNNYLSFMFPINTTFYNICFNIRYTCS